MTSPKHYDISRTRCDVCGARVVTRIRFVCHPEPVNPLLQILQCAQVTHAQEVRHQGAPSLQVELAVDELHTLVHRVRLGIT